MKKNKYLLSSSLFICSHSHTKIYIHNIVLNCVFLLKHIWSIWSMQVHLLLPFCFQRGLDILTPLTSSPLTSLIVTEIQGHNDGTKSMILMLSSILTKCQKQNAHFGIKSKVDFGSLLRDLRESFLILQTEVDNSVK